MQYIVLKFNILFFKLLIISNKNFYIFSFFRFFQGYLT